MNCWTPNILTEDISLYRAVLIYSIYFNSSDSKSTSNEGNVFSLSKLTMRVCNPG